jgi:hypothetical protein
MEKTNAEESAAQPQTAEGSGTVADPGTGVISATVRADPMMTLLLVVIGAFGVIGMALYALQLALKRRKRG